MSILPQARKLIEDEEGFVPFTYDDSQYPPRPYHTGERVGGTLTIGYGHTGPDVVAGKIVTQAQADAMLSNDLRATEREVDTLVKVPIDAFQRGALVSWDFNTGALKGSTLLRKLNAGDSDSVPAEMAKWNHTHINGKLVVSDGLTSRRAKEGALWKSLVATVDPTITVQHAQSPSAVGVQPGGDLLTPQNVPTAAGAAAGVLAAVSGNQVLSIALAVIAVSAFAIAAYFYIRHKVAPK